MEVQGSSKQAAAYCTLIRRSFAEIAAMIALSSGEMFVEEALISKPM
jgi:hypothetical protein